MQLTVRVTILFIIALLCAGAVPILVRAQTTVDTSAAVQIDAQVRTNQTQTRPLQLLREKALELKQDTRNQIDETKDRVLDVRATMQADIKTSTSAPIRRDLIQQAQDRLGELRDRQVELRGTLRERLQALLRTHLGSAIARLNAALRHFDNIVVRIESRIEKLQDREIDTTSAEALLEVAIDAIVVAKVDVEALTSVIGSVSNTSDAATIRAEIRAAIIQARDSVKAAHRALVATAKELVALIRASATINSTTTVDVDD